MKRLAPAAPLAFASPGEAPRLGIKPAHGLAAFCIGQVVLWGLAFGLTYSAPEVDSAEQFVWSFSMQSGYWKHPPLPSWIMRALLEVFGPSVVLPFVATQCCIVLALAIVWVLACELMSPARALVAVVLTSLVTYHNIGADTFNHNTALLPFQAATFLAFHRATRRASLGWWCVTGVAAALAVLVKYVAVLPIVGLLVYFAFDRALHVRANLLGLVVAALVFAGLLAPHALWLDATHYLPFRYARSVTETLPDTTATLLQLAEFLGIQCLRLAPFAGATAYVLLAQRRTVRLAPAVSAASPTAASARAPNDRLFIAFAALAPLAGTVLIALATQAALQSRWGANAFLLTGVLVMSIARRREDDAMVRRALYAAIAVQLVLCVGMTLGKTIVAERLGIRTRANFPGKVLAEHAHEIWKAGVPDVPLRIVVSDIWLGGNVIAHTSSPLAVLIDGHRFKAPWIRPGAITACGALVLDDLTSSPVPTPALQALFDRAEATGVWSLPWSRPDLHAGDEDRGRVRWGVILPRDPQHCPLR